MPHRLAIRAQKHHLVNNGQISTSNLEFEEISNEVSETISGGIGFYSRRFPQLSQMFDKIKKIGDDKADDDNTVVKNYESPDGLVKTTEIVQTNKYADYQVF
ncbi:MAG: hypothetical protein HC903_09010 [Methylacidiphilales bacterium]|nr:hypothetical protein [Candidatus Methylacidiphilales bacterium]NJR19957.1 hypothetical protein [Calothrix sp. CSU_2_0]